MAARSIAERAPPRGSGSRPAQRDRPQATPGGALLTRCKPGQTATTALTPAQAVLEMTGVIASYHLNAAQADYVRYGTNRTTGHERAWFVQHGDELVDTMAAPFGPDVVGLVETDVTNGVVGDHGGHNRLIQQIPRIFAGPGVVSKDPNREMRLVDVTPTVLDLMEIEYRPADFDGKAVKLP